MKLGIVGAGRVGGSLALYFKEKNIDFCWWTLNDKKRENLKSLIGNPLLSPEKVFENSDLTFICIKDDEIANFVQNLRLTKSGKVVHVSGSLGLDVLKPLKTKGFETGSFHPIQTFAIMSPDYLKNIYASFLGKDDTYEFLKEVFKEDIKILRVDENQKFLIHLSSTISSNFFIFLLRWSERILKKGGFELDMLFPLIENTLVNVKGQGVHKSITGPAKRKDFDTLAKHEKYLTRNFPELLKVYLEITRSLLKNE